MSTRKIDDTAALHDLSTADLATITGGGLHGEYGVERSVHANGKVFTQTGTYKVGRGDNLTSLARATNQSVDDLVRRNPQYAANPNLIHPGDRIVTGSSSTHD